MRLRHLLLVLLLVAFVAPAEAGSREIALGADGSLYRPVTGMTSELFPSTVAPSDRPILALEIVRPGQEPELLEVPGTGGHEVESSAAVLYQEDSDTAFLIWESRTNLIHSRIHLAWYSEGIWSEVINLSGEFFSLKTAPSLAITRDRYAELDDDGNLLTQARTVFHAVWWEEAAGGQQVAYSPVTLIEGRYIGWNPVFVLTDLDLGSEFVNAPLPTLQLSQAPAVQQGKNGGSVVVSVVDSNKRMLATLELEMIPGELALLADQIGHDILQNGGDLYPDDLVSLGDRARGWIADFGNRLKLNQGFIGQLGGGASELIAADAEESLASLGEKARGWIADFGARSMASGLLQAQDGQTAWLYEYRHGNGEKSVGVPEHLIRVRLAASLPTPATGVRPTWIFLSETAERALVVWESPNRMRYRESQDGEWSATRILRIHADLSREDALRILEDRAKSR